MKTKRCENCKYFVQHYVSHEYRGSTRMSKCGSGHCTYPRLKDRRLNDSCNNFKLNVDTQIRVIKDELIKQVKKACETIEYMDFYKNTYTNEGFRNLITENIEIEELLKRLEVQDEQTN